MCLREKVNRLASPTKRARKQLATECSSSRSSGSKWSTTFRDLVSRARSSCGTAASFFSPGSSRRREGEAFRQRLLTRPFRGTCEGRARDRDERRRKSAWTARNEDVKREEQRGGERHIPRPNELQPTPGILLKMRGRGLPEGWPWPPKVAPFFERFARARPFRPTSRFLGRANIAPRYPRRPADHSLLLSRRSLGPSKPRGWSRLTPFALSSPPIPRHRHPLPQRRDTLCSGGLDSYSAEVLNTLKKTLLHKYLLKVINSLVYCSLICKIFRRWLWQFFVTYLRKTRSAASVSKFNFTRNIFLKKEIAIILSKIQK